MTSSEQNQIPDYHHLSPQSLQWMERETLDPPVPRRRRFHVDLSWICDDLRTFKQEMKLMWRETTNTAAWREDES